MYEDERKILDEISESIKKDPTDPICRWVYENRIRLLHQADYMRVAKEQNAILERIAVALERMYNK